MSIFKRSRKFICTAVFVCTIVIIFKAPVCAGIASSTSEIEAKNLRIGETYNLTQIASLPFKVTSTGTPNRIKITLLSPPTEQCRNGYEPVPDVTWVSISKDSFDLLTGETGTADIIIKIPNDEKYLGKKYEMYIFSVTAPPSIEGDESMAVVGVGIRGFLRFSIAPRPLTEEERKKFEKAKFKLVNVELTPNDLVVEDVPVGKKVDVEKVTGQFLKLVNTGNESVKIHVNSLPVSETGIIAPDGWENTPDPAFLTFRSKKVKVNPIEIKKLPFYINFPKDDKYRGKKYFFVVEVYVEDDLIRTNYRSKIYVHTK